jgi:hypothetical protein
MEITLNLASWNENQYYLQFAIREITYTHGGSIHTKTTGLAAGIRPISRWRNTPGIRYSRPKAKTAKTSVSYVVKLPRSFSQPNMQWHRKEEDKTKDTAE